jgi:superfamily II DNA or RNA helicase
MHDDEETTMATLSSRRLVIDNLISQYRGCIANTAGDSVLAEFVSVLDAVTCRRIIGELREDGYSQVMVFTQYTDTLDFLRGEIGRDRTLRIMCFSGRGGEVISSDRTWRKISRDDVKRRFRNGDADVLFCTDAAAEGLNFQFCGALINYDMPWNPMKVEQRIGRIDRLGQRYPEIHVVNLHYADTVEADVYRALRERIGLFETVVGRLQPILARLPTLISDRVLAGQTRSAEDRQATMNQTEAEADRARAGGFDIDAVTETDLMEPALPPPPVSMDDLERVVSSPALRPPGIEVKPLGAREYAFREPGLAREVRISTNPAYYEQNADNVELWSPGNPTFPPLAIGPESVPADTLAELLQRSPKNLPSA